MSVVLIVLLSAFSFSGFVYAGLMSLCFSVNHGCVTALIAAASTLESKEFSGVVTGTLYTTYTISSLLFANGTLAKFGSKW
jgi:hypothetical protein